jgi:hypothetical protein
MNNTKIIKSIRLESSRNRHHALSLAHTIEALVSNLYHQIVYDLMKFLSIHIIPFQIDKQNTFKLNNDNTSCRSTYFIFE